MPIPQEQLFDYIIPALLFLFTGIIIFNKDVPLSYYLRKIDRVKAQQLGHLLLFISYFFDILPFLGVSGISSIISFTHYLKFIGAMCYVFAPSTFNYILLGLSYLMLAREAIANSVFLDFFMWSTYLFFIVSLRYDFSLSKRLSFIFIAAPVLIFIQSIKSEYREATWSGKRETGLDLITELSEKKQEQNDAGFAESEGVVRTVGRLNQGWHLGKVLKWVPKQQPFSYGEDMLGDIKGSILPRVFFPDKKRIGSQEKFRLYTGHKLKRRTSMTIGVLGDFYVNFGKFGSFIGLFIFGALISRLFYLFVIRYVLRDPISIVWIPFLFSYLVTANNDFYIVFNNLLKGFLIFLFVNYVRKKMFN
jgi:hypothetical protein